jgi:putative redox protein
MAEAEGLQLAGYKEGAPAPLAGSLRWERDLVFTAETATGYELELDAARQWGCLPMESLLLSLAGCMGIDALAMLKKMRIAVTALRIEVAGERNPDPPQYLKAVRLTLHVAGPGLADKHLDRVVSLSRAKYCSVYHSLRSDLQLSVDYHIDVA